MTQSNRRVLRVSIAGAVLALGLFGWLGWRDWTAREEAIERTADARLALDRAEAQIREIPKLEERVLVLREAVKEYVKVLPDDKEINSFVEQLTQFASRAGVKIAKLDDAEARARSGRKAKGATLAFDRIVYKLSLEGQCEQLLRFMDLFENHARFVRISTFKIGRKRGADRGADPTELPHDIDLELETYVYNAKVRSRDPVDVPQEAQKLDRLRTAGLVDADATRDLNLAVYHRRPAGERRDLFIDPRLAGGRRMATEAERRRQDELVTQLEEKVKAAAQEVQAEEKIDSLVRRMQQREKNDKMLVALGAEIARVRTEETFVVEQNRARFESAVEEPFRALTAGRELGISVGAVAVRQVEELVGRMKAALEEGRNDEVVAMHDELTRLRQAARVDDMLKPLYEEADGVQRVARTRLDFVARQLRIGGAVCYRDDPRHAVVIINDRSYSPGDPIDPDLTVRGITPHEVTFEFRGLVISQPIKGSRPAGTPSGPASTSKRKKS